MAYFGIVAGSILACMAFVNMFVISSIAFRHSIGKRKSDQLGAEEWQQRLNTARLRFRALDSERRYWAGKRKFNVVKKVFENRANSICSFYLYPHDLKPLPAYRPGQFIVLCLNIPDPDDHQIIDEENRCYSLSDASNSEYYRVSIRGAQAPMVNPENYPPGLVSNYMHEQVNEQDLIDVQAPSGEFFLDTSQNHPVVLIAGGVGVTPILSMLKTLATEQSSREIWIIYGVRNSDDLAFETEFQESLETLEQLRIYIIYSDVMPDDCDNSNDRMQHEFGYADISRLQSILPCNNYEYYICGPGPMMTALRHGLLDWGVPDRDIKYEQFTPDLPSPQSDALVSTDQRHVFSVSFSISKKTFKWSSEKSIYALSRSKKFKTNRIKYSCKQGKCGSCMTAVKSGSVQYPDIQPSFPNLVNGSCLPCICVPSSDIQLEA